MTDNEIIKALEYCFTNDWNRTKCDKCAFYTGTTQCVEDLKSASIDLINHQQAEIERLKSAKSEAVKEFAEELKERDGYYNHIFDDCSNTEFYSSNYVKGRQEKSREIRETIDNLVKEMVGENNG